MYEKEITNLNVQCDMLGRLIFIARSNLANANQPEAIKINYHIDSLTESLTIVNEAKANYLNKQDLFKALNKLIEEVDLERFDSETLTKEILKQFKVESA